MFCNFLHRRRKSQDILLAFLFKYVGGELMVSLFNTGCVAHWSIGKVIEQGNVAGVVCKLLCSGITSNQ
jgi:hypothetical protein